MPQSKTRKLDKPRHTGIENVRREAQKRRNQSKRPVNTRPHEGSNGRQPSAVQIVKTPTKLPKTRTKKTGMEETRGRQLGKGGNQRQMAEYPTNRPGKVEGRTNQRRMDGIPTDQQGTSRARTLQQGKTETCPRRKGRDRTRPRMGEFRTEERGTHETRQKHQKGRLKEQRPWKEAYRPPSFTDDPENFVFEKFRLKMLHRY